MIDIDTLLACLRDITEDPNTTINEWMELTGGCKVMRIDWTHKGNKLSVGIVLHPESQLSPHLEDMIINSVRNIIWESNRGQYKYWEHLT